MPPAGEFWLGLTEVLLVLCSLTMTHETERALQLSTVPYCDTFSDFKRL